MGKLLKNTGRIVLPAMGAGILAALFFTILSILEGFGDFKLFLSYSLVFSLVFFILNLSLFLYSKLYKVPSSVFNQSYLLCVSVLSFIVLYTSSFAIEFYWRSSEELEFYSFPRNISFVLAVLFFFGLSRLSRKAYKSLIILITFFICSYGLTISLYQGESYYGREPADKQDAPNILLLTIESLRYDHLGFTSQNKIKTPTLDKLIQEGIFFKNYFVQAPYTTASISSLMTGHYPFNHGSRTFGEKPNPEYRPFVENLAKNGYRVGIDSSYFMELFYDEKKPGLIRLIKNKSSSAMFIVNSYLGDFFPNLFGIYCFGHSTSMFSTSKLLKEIRLNKDKKWFFWTHFVNNCHWPYKSPPQFLEIYSQGKTLQKSEFSESDIERFKEHPEDLHDEVLIQIEAVYSAEVSCIDRQIEMILQLLKRLNILQKTIIIVSSDHGEALGETGKIGHGFSLQDRLIHVPLIFFSQNRKYLPQGRTIADFVEEIDIAPTILDLCGIKTRPDQFAGRSIMDLLSKSLWKKNAIYSEFVAWDNKKFFACFRTRDFKLLWESPANVFSFYDLKNDPQEARNMIQQYPKKAEAMKCEMLRLTGKSAFVDLMPVLGKKLDKDMEEELKALGYIK